MLIILIVLIGEGRHPSIPYTQGSGLSNFQILQEFPDILGQTAQSNARYVC
jgi:hypothetical protein